MIHYSMLEGNDKQGSNMLGWKMNKIRVSLYFNIIPSSNSRGLFKSNS